VLAEAGMATSVHFHEGAEFSQVESSLQEILGARGEGAHLYMCGPRPFMDLVATLSAAWPAGTVHREDFSADPAALMQEGEAFKVTLARSGVTYEIPAGESIVDVLARHGIEVNVSCQQGICGTCLTAVLEGTPDHRDMYLTDDEKEAGKRY
jgi:vanillate O-demethylase ferredoxin subunit